MIKLKWHKPGMRSLKTAVAVMACFLIFLPFWSVGSADEGGIIAQVGPFYACIAAVICMQSSVQQSVKQGVSRILGTLIGGILGLLILLLDGFINQPLFLMLLLGAGCIAVIWVCNTIQRPAACSLGCIVLCVVLLNHSGTDRYLYLLIRVGETLAGVLVAVAVNHLLPDFRSKQDSDAPTL